MTSRRVSERLRQTRTVLRLSALVSAAGVGALSGAILGAVATVFGASAGATRGLAVLTAAAAGWIEYSRRGARHLSLPRCALWVEERVRGFRYALVSAAEQAAPNDYLDRAIDVSQWARVERQAVLAAIRRGVLLGMAGVVLWLGSDRVTTSRWVRDAVRTARPGQDRAAALPVRVRVVPPPYTHRPELDLGDPTRVTTLAGSAVSIEVDDTAVVARLDETAALTTRSGRGTVLSLRVVPGARALTLRSAHRGRVIAIEGIVDSAPRVELVRPERDTIFRSPTGRIPLAARVSDDIGVTTASFEYIVSSGEGESYTFRSGVLGSRALAGVRAGQIDAQLSLDALQLKPGDLIHVRAVARDANDVTGPGVGSSETRTLRIARAGEDDSVAVEGAAPPEEDKSLLSQRMLINLTEALRARRRALERASFMNEAGRIARDQGRLRRQVGDIIFDRLGDQPSGEHAHDVDESRPLTKEELLKAAEEATRADAEVLDFASDETPVTSINRPLLEAYNAMWDAGRELGVADLDGALPHMYRALSAIQRARTAERLYLRGRAPKVVVDVDKARLQGKERGVSNRLAARPAADTLRALDRQRFAHALLLRNGDGAQVIDSLLLLRISLVSRNAPAARALDEAVDALRRGRDATEALARARRALDGNVVAADSLSRWNGGAPLRPRGTR